MYLLLLGRLTFLNPNRPASSRCSGNFSSNITWTHNHYAMGESSWVVKSWELTNIHMTLKIWQAFQALGHCTVNWPRSVTAKVAHKHGSQCTNLVKSRFGPLSFSDCDKPCNQALNSFDDGQKMRSFIFVYMHLQKKITDVNSIRNTHKKACRWFLYSVMKPAVSFWIILSTGDCFAQWLSSKILYVQIKPIKGSELSPQRCPFWFRAASELSPVFAP